MKKNLIYSLFSLLAFVPALPLNAADHGDAPSASSDQACDIADVFAFLDPNDNSQVVLTLTSRGFIASGENANFGIFDPVVRYRFEIENSGDFIRDLTIDVTFSPRLNTATAQTGTVRFSSGQTFSAPATNASLAATAPTQVVTTDAATGISFFAGLTDDPFFFDIPAFSRFIASVNASAPNPAVFQRGRDSFAGYNCMAISLRIPAALIKGAGSIIGVSASTARQRQFPNATGTVTVDGSFRQVDRMGNPAVNVALMPFADKNAYNAATTKDDVAGRFAPGIVGTLTALGSNSTTINTLASVAVTNGDFLRLDLTKANTGNGGGDNAAAAYPNGRRLIDDTIDILLTIIANGSPLGDNVNANDVPLRNTFPFIGLPQQPRDPGVTDDNTRN